MEKSLLIIIALLCYSQLAIANEYRVEIAVFEQSVVTDYFHNIKNVKVSVDQNNLFRYYLGNFDSLEEAKEVQKEAIAKGRKYARIIDITKERETCAMTCKTPLYVENIFFDFDRYRLKSKSRRDLNQLVKLLEDNPAYKVDLNAHTDAHGSMEYNISLSRKRGRAAQNYLIKNGIAAMRIMPNDFGESDPIAKNEINGKDSPAGRQFNRRVVITVLNAKGMAISNIVKPINVPPVLKVD